MSWLDHHALVLGLSHEQWGWLIFVVAVLLFLETHALELRWRPHCPNCRSHQTKLYGEYCCEFWRCVICEHLWERPYHNFFTAKPMKLDKERDEGFV